MSVTMTEPEESASPNSGTAAGMIAFLNWLIRKNEMVENSAIALRTGCRKVFDVEGEAWADLDMRTLDVDAILLRFRNKYRGDLAERSMSNYEQRFKNTIEMYVKWLGNDPSWRPSSRTRNTAAAAKRSKVTSIVPPEIAAKILPAGGTGAVAEIDAPKGPGMITYPLPLRPGLKATLHLPEDLTAKEAARVAQFVSALAFEEQLQITAGPSHE